MNILIEYYKKYFQDISEIDYLDHVHDETMESNDLIEIQERTMGISFKAIHLLYPLCQKHMEENKEICSWIILFLNGENNTGWNIRMELKNPNDLKLTQLICIKFPNSSVAYNYRLQLQSSLILDYDFFMLAYNRKSKNYNLWTYRLKMLSKLKKVQLYEEEVNIMKKLAEKDVHNHSIFHHIFICSRKCSAEVLEWAIDLKEKFKQMYQGQVNDSELEVTKLFSLNHFIKCLMS